MSTSFSFKNSTNPISDNVFDDFMLLGLQVFVFFKLNIKISDFFIIPILKTIIYWTLNSAWLTNFVIQKTEAIKFDEAYTEPVSFFEKPGGTIKSHARIIIFYFGNLSGFGILLLRM